MHSVPGVHTGDEDATAKGIAVLLVLGALEAQPKTADRATPMQDNSHALCGIRGRRTRRTTGTLTQHGGTATKGQLGR